MQMDLSSAHAEQSEIIFIFQIVVCQFRPKTDKVSTKLMQQKRHNSLQ